jgi:hypothetical protein
MLCFNNKSSERNVKPYALVTTISPFSNPITPFLLIFPREIIQIHPKKKLNQTYQKAFSSGIKSSSKPAKKFIACM